MKKVFMSAAIVAMMVAAASCECNNSKKAEAEEPVAEQIAEEASEAEDAVGPVDETGPLGDSCDPAQK